MSAKGKEAVKEAVELWMAHQDVTGVSLTEEDGEEMLLVLVESLTDDVQSFLPDSFKGYKVKILEVGEIRAEEP